MFCLFWQLLSRECFFFHEIKRQRGSAWCERWEWFTDSWWAEEEEYERMLFVVPTILLPPDGCRNTERQNTIISFICLCFCTQHSEFLQTEPSWPEGDGYPRNYDKRVREQGWEKGQDIWARDKKRETEERKQSRRARWETSRKLPTLPLFPPQSVGPLASSNCVSLPGAAMVKSV